MRNIAISGTFIIIVLTGIIAIYFQSVEIHHLESENAKFKHEIEYLKGSNDLLQEDNRDMQDRLWNLNNTLMKETNK